MTAWQNRIAGSGEEDPTQLLANPKNWRIHPKAQQDALSGALDQVGWVQQVIVNRTTGHMVDGHLRVELAISRGEDTVPVTYVDLTPEEEALVLASLDPISAMAGRDDEKLRMLLAEVEFDSEELRRSLEALTPWEAKASLTDPDAIPEPTAEPRVARGDLFQLGRHRLLCGDSTDGDDVDRVLGGAKPNLMVTDPPYGVNYDPAWRNRAAEAGHIAHARRRVGNVTNDDRADWEQAYRLFAGDVAYVWHAGVMPHVAKDGLEASGFEIRAQIIWAKSRFAISRGHYNGQHEPCWYAVRKGATASWLGSASESTLWQSGWDANVEGGHSTQKPVEIMAHPIRNHEGDVYEPFSGSGTTIIAAEQNERACYAIEIEPAYVRVAITRWEQFTGRQAVQVGAADGPTDEAQP